MNRSLCLLLLYLNWDVEGYSASYRQGSHRTFLGYSGNSASDTDTDTDDSWSNTKREDSMCFKVRLSLYSFIKLEDSMCSIIKFVTYTITKLQAGHYPGYNPGLRILVPAGSLRLVWRDFRGKFTNSNNIK